MGSYNSSYQRDHCVMADWLSPVLVTKSWSRSCRRHFDHFAVVTFQGDPSQLELQSLAPSLSSPPLPTLPVEILIGPNWLPTIVIAIGVHYLSGQILADHGRQPLVALTSPLFTDLAQLVSNLSESNFDRFLTVRSIFSDPQPLHTCILLNWNVRGMFIFFWFIVYFISFINYLLKFLYNYWLESMISN